MSLNLPPAFNKKKKLGPQRVCDGCRYRVVAGARLDDGTQDQIQSFLRQQSSSAQQSPLTPTPNLTNETGPIRSSIPSLRQHRLSLTNTPNSAGAQTPIGGQIKILYANTPGAQNQTRTIVVPQPSPLALSTPRENRMSVSSHNIETPQNHPHHVYELEQITASLNSLSLNDGSSVSGSHHESSEHGTPGGGLTNIQHDLGASGITTTMATRSQRYAAAAASPLTPKNNISSTPQATTTNPDRPFLDPMGEHLNLAMGASAQPRFRPAGGRDIFRALSAVTKTTPNTPSATAKTNERTLDDQKEGEMDDNNQFVPPPPPLPAGAVEHAQLVKPSDIFGKLRQQKE